MCIFKELEALVDCMTGKKQQTDDNVRDVDRDWTIEELMQYAKPTGIHSIE